MSWKLRVLDALRDLHATVDSITPTLDDGNKDRMQAFCVHPQSAGGGITILHKSGDLTHIPDTSANRRKLAAQRVEKVHEDDLYRWQLAATGGRPGAHRTFKRSSAPAAGRDPLESFTVHPQTAGGGITVLHRSGDLTHMPDTAANRKELGAHRIERIPEHELYHRQRGKLREGGKATHRSVSSLSEAWRTEPRNEEGEWTDAISLDAAKRKAAWKPARSGKPKVDDIPEDVEAELRGLPPEQAERLRATYRAMLKRKAATETPEARRAAIRAAEEKLADLMEGGYTVERGQYREIPFSTQVSELAKINKLREAAGLPKYSDCEELRQAVMSRSRSAKRRR